MKPILSLALLLGFSGSVFAQQEEPEPEGDFPPQRFEAARYAEIFERNPFVSEVALTATETAVEDTWAKGIVLRAVNRIGGKYVVHVEDTALAKEKDPTKKRLQFQRLEQDGLKGSGLRLVTVKAHRDPNQVEVLVASSADANAKTAVIRYDQKASQAPKGASLAPPPQAPPVAAPATAPASQERPTREQLREVMRNRMNQQGGGAVRGGRGGRGGGDAQAQGGRGGGGRQGRRGGDASSTEAPKRQVLLPPGVSR